MPAPNPADDPLYTGEMRARADLTLGAILRALLVVLPVLLLASVLGDSTPAESAALALALPYTIALFLLQRRGHFAVCVYAIVYGLIILGAGIAALYGSVRSVGIVGQIAAITVGGLFLGRRALMLAVGLSVGSIALLIYAENAGWLRSPNYAVTASHWVIYSMIIAAVALILSYMRLLLVDLVRRLRSELTQRQKAEAGHSQSEAKYKAVFSSAPDPIIIGRVRDAVQLEANQAWFRITGYAREQAIGRSSLELGLWVDRAQREKVLAQVIAEGAVDNVPVKLRVAGGQTIDALLSGIRVTLDSEPCVVWTWRDQTEQLKQQRALADSEERFSKAFQASQDAIAISDLPHGRLISVNRRLEAMFGAPAAEIVGKTAMELLAWADGEATRDRIAAQMREDGRVRNMELKLRTRSGEVRTCEYSAETLELGGTPHAIAFLRDVTEQRRAEARERQALERFQTVFDHSPESIAISRLSDGKLLAVNDAWIRVNGFSREEVIGRETPRIGIWRGNARQEFMSDLIAARHVSNRYLTFSRKDGSPRHSMVSATLTDLDGEPCIIWMSRDITDQQRAEEELRSNRRLLETVVDAIPMSIFAKDLDSKYILLNKRMAEFFGKPKEEMLQQHTLQLPVSDPTRNKSLRDDEWVFKHQRTLDQPDVLLERPDGVQIPYHSTKIPLFDEAGKLMGLLGINRDIAEEKRAQEALRSSQRLLETVIDAIPMPIFAKDLNSNYIMLNKRMADFFGARKEEILQLHTSRLPIPDATRSKSIKDDAWVFGNLRTLDQPDVFLEGSDGVRINYHSTKIPLFDDSGKPIGLLGINREITEEKRAQEALRDSEHRYRSLFQAAMDCILVISPEGAIIDINSFGCRTLGYSREELLGGSFARILDEAKLARLLPRPRQVRNERRSLRAEQEVRAKDGSTRAVEFTAGALPDGNILVVARDVTERRRNEQLLDNIAKGVSSQTGAEFFRTLVMALCRELPAHMVFVGETVGGNRVRSIACAIDGTLVENFEYPLAGTPCVLALERRGTVIHPHGVAELFPEDAGLARRGISGYAGTSLFDAADNAIGILVALTRDPIERKEFVVSMLEIFAARAAAEIERARADAKVRELNISLERRVRERTAELETANRDLDSFGYSVSHDLRSPLGALNGFAHLLRTREVERLSPEGVHLLLQLESNASRMTNLVEGLLEFSRLGRRPLTRVAVPMAALVNEVVEEISAENRHRHVNFRVGALAGAYGDPMLLRQVWRNLIGNAVKYSRARDPALIEIGSDPATGEYYVRDNGAGFDMQYAGKLFGVFERLHSESEFEGNGVGLAIVQRVVNRHGGTVRGEGRPGRGATFRFTLPAR